MSHDQCACGERYQYDDQFCAACGERRQEATTLPGAGWFIDPQHMTRERWWDGAEWTEHRRSGTKQPEARTPFAEWEPPQQLPPLPRTRPTLISPTASRLLPVVPWLGVGAVLVGTSMPWVSFSVEVDQILLGSYSDNQTLEGGAADVAWIVGSIPDGFVLAAVQITMLVLAIWPLLLNAQRKYWMRAALGPVSLLWIWWSYKHFERQVHDAVATAGVPGLTYSLSWLSGFKWSLAGSLICAAVSIAHIVEHRQSGNNATLPGSRISTRT